MEVARASIAPLENRGIVSNESVPYAGLFCLLEASEKGFKQVYSMKLKATFITLAVCALMLVPTAGAQAQTYYYGGTSYSHQELISYLYQLIAQLQAQQGSGGTSSYNVRVETTSASSVDEDSASLYGSVWLHNASYARVWFDYGTSGSFGEKTLTGTARSGGQYTFRADLEGLREDRTYYYRAVAEDPRGARVYGATRTFETDGDGYDDDDDDYDGDTPDVTTEDADDVDEDRAELNGEVDMNDFEDGTVFFVYGQDEDQVEEIEDEYDTYSEIDEDGQDLQKVRVDTGLDDDESYSEVVTNLEEDERYYFQICVEYEDEDNDDRIECGGVEDFETERDGSSSNDDEPDVATRSAENVEDDEAELHGTVDMNDFENGIVFFVFGQDEDLVEEIEDEYETYDEIDEEGDDLEKVRVDSDLDDSASYELRVSGLDDDTDYYFQICVEYEDEDNDEVLVCGGVEDFRTDN